MFFQQFVYEDAAPTYSGFAYLGHDQHITNGIGFVRRAVRRFRQRLQGLRVLIKAGIGHRHLPFVDVAPCRLQLGAKSPVR
jgi:hypothetical protein